jgi:hypothetical protein
MKLLRLVNPIAVAEGAFGLAGSAVGLVQAVAGQTGHVVLSSLRRLGMRGEQHAGTAQTDYAAATDPMAPATSATDDTWMIDVEGATKGPTIVPVEPHAPEAPPVDVVGEALAAEAALGDHENPDGAGFAHEPRGSSRDEEHEDIPIQRAEADGIADEVSAALEGDAEQEEHLSEPVLDPAQAKAVAAELRTMSRAADPHND